MAPRDGRDRTAC